jgi:alpha-L-arabinofuranosidase
MRLRTLLALCLAAGAASAQVDLEIDVEAAKTGPALAETLYGVFYEDINYAGDGGLYAELLQNRSFEYYPVKGWKKRGDQMHPLYAWEAIQGEGSAVALAVESAEPLNGSNTKYLVMCVSSVGKAAGVRNAGYEGVPVKKGEEYRFSLYARRTAGGDAPLTVTIRGSDDSVLASGRIDGVSDSWKKHEIILKASESDAKASLAVTIDKEGTICLDMASLFPVKTFKGRKNGLREDLAQAIADLKPKTFRFPGGCIVHGRGLGNAYRWKNTVGDVAERKPDFNRWGYHQGFGLGYFEYMQFAADIGAEPLPILPVGVSCGFEKPFENAAMDKLQEWVDDALDLVEFANGPVESRWGAVRAAMGRPEPFSLKYIGLGNEEHHTKEFEERFPYFVKALRERCPEIQIVGTSGLGPEMPIYDFMNRQGVEITDEHYYMAPEWYIENEDRFDTFDRSKVRIYVGEYASRGNKQFNAVAEAVFLTGIERNADMVLMTAYAPLLARYDFTQWKAADLIWFDHERVVLTPNYHVQRLFSVHKGDHYVPCTRKIHIATEPVPPKIGEAGLAGRKIHDITEKPKGLRVGVAAARDNAAGELIIKIANPLQQELQTAVNLNGIARVARAEAQVITLAGGRDDINDLANPERVKPVESTLRVAPKFTCTVPAMSVQFIRVKVD